MKEKIRNSSIVRRLLSIIAAVVMTLGMVGGNAIPAMAANGEYTITIDNSKNTRVSISGKTYSAYKVFDVTLGNPTTNDGNTTYGAYSYTIKNTDWAFTPITSGVTADATTGVYDLTSQYGIKLEPTGNGSNTYNVTGTMTNDQARALANALTSEITKTTGKPVAAATETATGESVVLDVSESGAGYYAVYGTANPKDKKEGEEELIAALALTTTDKTPTVEPKVDAPTLDKKITGVKDGTTTKTGAVLSGDKAATAAVGDTVSFQLDSVVPDMTGYSNYTYEITDTLSSGLDFVKDATDNSKPAVKVTIDSGDLTSGYTAEFDSTDSQNRTIKITIPYATLKKYTKGSAITVTYDATVNEAAVNKNYDNNTASLKYSNNPSDTSKTETTPDKKTYVINVNLNVNKVAGNESGNKLSGAKFKLYKGSDSSLDNVWYQYDSNSRKVTWVDETKATVFTTNAQGSFDTPIYGLGNGNYNLVETEAPAGYNKLDDAIPVTISAAYGSGENSQKVVISATGAAVTDGVIDITNTATNTSALATATVVNKSGTELPSTGGIGTTIFYVIGGVVVAGAVILLLARRRKNA